MTIERGVGQQSKGFTLQRLRALKLLIENMLEKENSYLYAATEYYDDVYFKSVNGEDVSEVSEGDKSYESVKGFSFMSVEVKNSIVSFFDCWFQNVKNENLIFCFYTNVNISKERTSELTKTLEINLPDKPILEKIINKEYEKDSELLLVIKKVIIDEYEKQYSSKEDKGFTEEIKKLSDDLWKDFLNKIHWKFNEEDEKELRKTLEKDISKFSNDKRNLIGKEKFVISDLLVELEERQTSTDLVSRLLTNDRVERIMYEIAVEKRKIDDPIYNNWKEIENDDKRNINDKIKAVCPDFSDKLIGIYSRRIGNIRAEYKTVLNKHKSAYQYRIFDVCDEKLYELIEENEFAINQDLLKNWIKELNECAEEHIKEMSKDFYYPFKNNKSIEGAVLELFDSCYLAFELGD